MKVEKETLDKWQSLYAIGDIPSIVDSLPENQRVTNETIRVCLKRGEFKRMSTFDAVNKFYTKRAKELAKKLAE